jgi:predicted helicase
MGVMGVEAKVQRRAEGSVGEYKLGNRSALEWILDQYKGNEAKG